MPYGLTKSDLEEIEAVVRRFPSVERVLLFGSRAMGNFKKGSDIDLALTGSVTFQEVSSIRGELNEESTSPYFFDVIDYHTIEKKELTEHIDRYGIEIYRK